ncbi:MAG: glutathione peroxidase [Planctomycetota bacterium]|nr:MAG: glutathione peroxidase [Planctomycetota bacterium]
MKLLLLLSIALLAACSSHSDAPKVASAAAPAAAGLHALKAKSLDGKEVALSQYAGRVVLVVNVASECGYTKQYAGLETLHDELGAKGFEVLGFPSNEFGGQEPGSAAEIQSFCTSKFGVTFPLFEKLETKPGVGQSPIYAYLGGATGQTPAWNFGKYLVDKQGKAVAYYPSKVAPEDAELRAAIERELAR